MAVPDLSIALVTLDGADTLPALLDAIDEQAVDQRPEIVAVDSGSTDGTIDLLKGRVDHLIEIPQVEFNHGRTRNLAIEQCSGKLVILLVQDAYPADRYWLRELTAPFAQDSDLAGTFARQRPRPEAQRLTRRALGRWITTQDKPRRVVFADPAEMSRLSPEDRFLSSVFDNVCSCIRRSVWAQIPFESLPIAEDLAWGKAVLGAGFALQYVPEAVVLHSHERSINYEFNRTRLVHHQLGRLFGLRTIPSLPALLRSFSVTLVDHLECLKNEPGPRPSAGEILRALGLAFAWPYGQWLGGRSAERGKRS